jgi:hypothetical protein
MSGNPIVINSGFSSAPRRISGSSYDTANNNTKDNQKMDLTSANTIRKSQLNLSQTKKDVFIKINCGLIDVLEVEQKFISDFSVIEAWYVDDNKDDKFPQLISLTEDGKKPDWKPDMTFYNSEFELMMDPEFYRYKNIYFKFLNTKVTANEILELQHFPFDRQVLHLKFDSLNSNILPMPNDLLHQLSLGLPRHYENIFEVVNDVTKYTLDDADIVIDDKTNQCKVNLMVTRKPMFYITNVVCVMFTIVFITISVYGIPVDDYGSKLSITVTALLTAVAFKLVANGFCPPVSYLTLLDKYILISFATLLVIVAENFIVSQMEYDAAVKLDVAFSIIILLWWVLLHLFIAIGTKLDLFYLSWKDVAKDDTPPEKKTKTYFDRRVI